jgi:hypothetical protein
MSHVILKALRRRLQTEGQVARDSRFLHDSRPEALLLARPPCGSGVRLHLFFDRWFLLIPMGIHTWHVLCRTLNARGMRERQQKLVIPATRLLHPLHC